MNEAHVEAEYATGEKATLKHEGLAKDEYFRLASPGAIHSLIGLSVGTQQNFGEVKITATVNLHCDQNEPTINEAGKLAFLKATELLQDGLAILNGNAPK